jgi:hypothetical protein
MQTEASIRTASNPLRIVFILPVIFPPANRAHFEASRPKSVLNLQQGHVKALCAWVGSEMFLSMGSGQKRHYCGNCLMLVTWSPWKRMKTVFEGGWP